MIKYIIIIITLWICSCSTLEQKTKFQDVLSEDLTINRILYLYFSANHDSLTHKTNVEILEIKTPKGLLKKGFYKKPEMFPGNWLCSFFDSKNNVIEKIEIENPLVIRGEFPDEKGNYESIVETRETIEFFIRINLNRNFQYLTIYEILKNGELNLIKKFDLLEK